MNLKKMLFYLLLMLLVILAICSMWKSNSNFTCTYRT